MNKAEARKVLAERMRALRENTYADYCAWIAEKKTVTLEVQGASGVAYQIEIVAVWDAAPGGNIRVLGAIDDGGWHAFRPLCDDFLIAPNGSFVGES